MAHATPEQKNALRLGEATINGVYDQLKREEESFWRIENEVLQAKNPEPSRALNEDKEFEKTGDKKDIDRTVHCENCDANLTRGKVKRVPALRKLPQVAWHELVRKTLQYSSLLLLNFVGPIQLELEIPEALSFGSLDFSKQIFGEP